MRYEGTSGVTVGHLRRDELTVRTRIERDDREGDIFGSIELDSFDLKVDEHGMASDWSPYYDSFIRGAIDDRGFQVKFDRPWKEDDHLDARRTTTGYEGTFKGYRIDGVSFTVDQDVEGPLGTRTGEFVQQDSALHLEFRSRPLDALGGVRELSLTTPDGSVVASMQLPGDMPIETETAIAGYLFSDFYREHDDAGAVIGPAMPVIM